MPDRERRRRRSLGGVDRGGVALRRSAIVAGAIAIAAVLLASVVREEPTSPSRQDGTAGTAVDLPTAAGTRTPDDVFPTLDSPAQSAVSFRGCGEPAEPAGSEERSWSTYASAPFEGEPVVGPSGQVVLVGRTADGSTRLAHWAPPRLQWGCATLDPGLGEELKLAADRDVIAVFDGNDVGILDLPGQTWQVIAAPPVNGIPLSVGFSSRRLLVFAQSGPTIEVAGYDLDTEMWSEPASPDATVSRATVASFGSRFAVLGNWSGMATDGDASVIGMVYDPAQDFWQVLPPAELSPLAVTGVESGGRLIAVDYLMEAAAYDQLTSSWEALPDVPLDQEECSPTLMRTGAETVTLDRCGQYAALDVSTERWVTVDPPEPGAFDRGSGQLVGGQDRIFLLAENRPTFSTRPASWFQ